MTIFAVVLTDQVEVAPKDKGLLRECQSRLPQFKASRELDQTLINVIKLEQLIGKRIDWVAAPFTFDQLIKQNTSYPSFRNNKIMLPNKRARFCTHMLKIMPIFWQCFLNYYDGDPLLMNIGFRYDEPNRVNNWNCDNDKFKYPFACSLAGSNQWQYKNIEWRISHFPMYEFGIDASTVRSYWESKNWIFPMVSNCDFCFHHRTLQQQVQAAEFPSRAAWWLKMEDQAKASFSDIPLSEILNQQLIPEIFAEEEFACNCTD